MGWKEITPLIPMAAIPIAIGAYVWNEIHERRIQKQQAEEERLWNLPAVKRALRNHMVRHALENAGMAWVNKPYHVKSVLECVDWNSDRASPVGVIFDALIKQRCGEGEEADLALSFHANAWWQWARRIVENAKP